MRVKWKTSGSFETFEEGKVIDTLLWPDTETEEVRAYVVKSNNGDVVIVRMDMIVEASDEL